MTTAAEAFNHRELEIFEKDINAQVVSSENRIEKSIMSLQNAMKDMELRLVREIHSVKDELGERIHAVEKNLSFINRISGFFLSIGSLAVIIFGLLHAHIAFN